MNPLEAGFFMPVFFMHHNLALFFARIKG